METASQMIASAKKSLIKDVVGGIDTRKVGRVVNYAPPALVPEEVRRECLASYPTGKDYVMVHNFDSLSERYNFYNTHAKCYRAKHITFEQLSNIYCIKTVIALIISWVVHLEDFMLLRDSSKINQDNYERMGHFLYRKFKDLSISEVGLFLIGVIDGRWAEVFGKLSPEFWNKSFDLYKKERYPEVQKVQILMHEEREEMANKEQININAVYYPLLEYFPTHMLPTRLQESKDKVVVSRLLKEYNYEDILTATKRGVEELKDEFSSIELLGELKSEGVLFIDFLLKDER